MAHPGAAARCRHCGALAIEGARVCVACGRDLDRAGLSSNAPTATVRLRASMIIGRLRDALGPDRFDLIRIVAVVSLVGIAIAVVQIIASGGPVAATARRADGPEPQQPATPRVGGPTNPGEPTFRATQPVPPPSVLRGRGPRRALEPECPGVGQRVCIFYLGEPPLPGSRQTVDIEDLAAYLHATYGLPIATLPAIALAGIEEYEGRVVDQGRQQLKGAQLLEVMQALFPTSAQDGKVTFIAVTPHDLYREFEETPYLYAVRASSPPTRFSIVSNARMDDRAWGEPTNFEVLRARTRKLISREVGAFHFGIPASPEPTSLMHDTFGSRAGVDRADERLDLSQATLRPLTP